MIKERDVSMNESELKDIDKAYLAGLFDGEGCASVSYTQYRKKGRDRLYDSCRVHLAISNMDENVLRDVLLMIGEGGIYRQKRVSSFRTANPRVIIEIIEMLKPYVRIRVQSLENLGTAAGFILKVRGPNRRHTWTEEEKNKFKELAKMSRALKGGGKKGRPRKNRV